MATQYLYGALFQRFAEESMNLKGGSGSTSIETKNGHRRFAKSATMETVKIPLKMGQHLCYAPDRGIGPSDSRRDAALPGDGRLLFDNLRSSPPRF